MRISKLFISSCLFASVSSTLIFTSSCAKTWADDTQENDYTNYIKDRTFAISGSSTRATAWILSDSTKDDKTDYKYYICTNMHAARKMAKDSDIKYSDYSLADEQGYISSYISFSSHSDITNIETDTQYLYNLEHTDYLKYAIDLAIFEVDFGTPTDPIKEKLDRLNQLSSINTFVTINDNSTDIHNSKKHIGGYPLKYSSTKQKKCAKWECHNFAGDELRYCSINTIYSDNQKGHPIGNPDKNQQGQTIQKESTESYYWYDVSPQYYSKQIRPADYMEPGASGSLMIDDNYHTIGIYWGGWEQDDGKIYPSFTLFNTQYKNFIENYI